ncbi:MAG: hypothetical protein ABJ370_17045 [Paracoccaceae bacterium]
MIHKACPVVLHPDGAPLRHLQYRHPETGLQLVTTTIPQDDNPVRSATHYLFKATGLETSAAIPLGHSDEIANKERWHFTLCRIKPPVRDEWAHVNADDPTYRLLCSWFLLDDISPDMSASCINALRWIHLNAI